MDKPLEHPPDDHVQEAAPGPLPSAGSARLGVPRDELSLRDLVLLVLRGWWIVLGTLILALLAATAWTKTKPALYTASMVLAPVTGSGAQSMPSRAAALVGAVGFDLPGTESVSNFERFQQILASVTLAERLQAKYAPLQTIFKNSWDAENRRWVRPPLGIRGRIRSSVVEFFDLPTWTPPSAKSLARFLRNAISISRIKTTGMIKIEFQNKDPEFAVAMLRWIHADADDLLRAEALARTSKQISYLERKLQTVSVKEHQLAIIGLISKEERSMMMLQGDLPFSASIVEPPTATDAPTQPRPAFNLAVAAVIGILLGIFLVVFMRLSWAPSR